MYCHRWLHRLNHRWDSSNTILHHSTIHLRGNSSNLLPTRLMFLFLFLLSQYQNSSLYHISLRSSWLNQCCSCSMSYPNLLARMAWNCQDRMLLPILLLCWRRCYILRDPNQDRLACRVDRNPRDRRLVPMLAGRSFRIIHLPHFRIIHLPHYL